MTYRQVFTPDKEHRNFEMPEEFFGKEVVVIVEEIEKSVKSTYPKPPQSKKVSIDELLEDFGAAPDFPTIEEIRAKAWPSKW